MSLTHEQVKKSITELTQQFDEHRKKLSERIEENTEAVKNAIIAFDRLAAQFNICHTHLTVMCDNFEGRFDNETFTKEHYSECVDYLGAARFLALLGRTNNRTKEVKKFLDNLTA